jgi:hypothetical protein
MEMSVGLTPRPLYLQGKIPWYPLERRLGGPQNRSGRCVEEKNEYVTGRNTKWYVQSILGVSQRIAGTNKHCRNTKD